MVMAASAPAAASPGVEAMRAPRGLSASAGAGAVKDDQRVSGFE